MNKREFVNHLYLETSEYKNEKQAQMAAKLLDTVSADIYSESQRFIFELIQNADDAAMGQRNEVLFEFHANCLIVSHNGQPFNEQDINSLTGAGDSTKIKDVNKTGYKGIGFKSVFAKSERVTIFSDGYQFRFDKKQHKKILPWQVIPIWTEVSDLPEEIRESVAQNTYNVQTIIEISSALQLLSDLKILLKNAQILLFLRRIDKITIIHDRNIVFDIVKSSVQGLSGGEEVDLIVNNSHSSSWITQKFSEIYIPEHIRDELRNDDKIPDKLKEIEFTEMSFAAKVEGGNLKALRNSESLIYTYLPTKVSSFEFPFLINGNFLTNAAREVLHEDKIWNQWMFEVIAEKMFVWLSILSLDKYRFQLLLLLSPKFNSQQQLLKRSFDKGFNAAIDQHAFITTQKGTVKRRNEVLLDKTDLSQQLFVDPNSIVDFIHVSSGRCYDADCFVHKSIQFTEVLASVGVQKFDIENFEEFFCSTSFKDRHKIEDNISLIRYFKGKADNDQKGEWVGMLKALPFIYSNSSILSNPTNGICFPIGVNKTDLGEIPVIHPVVFSEINKDQILYQWMVELGVKEPGDVSYVTNVLIPNMHIDGFIGDENYLRVTVFLLKLFKDSKLEEDVLNNLRMFKLKSKTGNFVQASLCYLSDRYGPVVKLEESVKDIFYVSEEYIKIGETINDWYRFFKAIKVLDSIEIDTIDNINVNDITVLTNSDWLSECQSGIKGFGFGSWNILRTVKLPSFLNLTSSDRSYAKFFWQNILGNANSLSELQTPAVYVYGTGLGRNRYRSNVESYFTWFVRKHKCIPASNGNIVAPQDAYINTSEVRQIAGKYLPVFDVDVPVSSDWMNVLQFRPRLELEDYLLIMERIAADTENGGVTKSNIKRIGQIYNKIAALIPDMAVDSKQKIVEWAREHVLLSVNGSFQPAGELKWILIEGFKIESEKIKAFMLPPECDKNSEGIRELIELFQVHCISSFVPIFESEKISFDFKNKLQTVLPIFATLSAKRKSVDKDDEYNRLFEILNESIFYSATSIRLTFKYKNEIIDGPTLSAYVELPNVYFKGLWKSERTLLGLLKELAALLNVPELKEELRFLIMESSTVEVSEWLAEQGISEDELPLQRKFVVLGVPNDALLESQGRFENSAVPVHNTAGNTSNSVFSTTHDDGARISSHYENSNMEIFSHKRNPGDFENAKVSLLEETESNISSVVTSGAIIENGDVRSAIGRWSEEHVFIYLKESEQYDEVVWVNEHGESGMPYDIRVVKNGEIEFIEVKGTPSSDKCEVYLSSAELIYLLNKREAYSIYRVTEAGAAGNIKIVNNAAEKLANGEIYPSSISLQIP